jgi:hypothetical protein
MFPDFSWFIRAVRILPIVAGAALAGGVIGGVSVFAIDSALTPPSHRDVLAKAEPSANPIRTVGGSAPDASAGMSAGPPVQAQPAPVQPQTPAPASAPAQPIAPVQAQTAAPAAAPATPPALASQQAAWPDALSRGHAAAAPEAVAATPQSTPPQAKETQQAKETTPDSANGPLATSQASKPAPLVKKRVIDERADDSSDFNTPHPHTISGIRNQPTRHIIVQHQRPDDADDDSDADDTVHVLPPQPPPRPLFWGGGVFGGGDRDDDGN